MTGDEDPTSTTLYYDPQLDVHHRLPVASALTTAFYAAPQQPDDARRLFEAACRSIGLDGEPRLPLRPARGYGSSLVLAREWAMTDLEERLAAAIEASYEPTWDRQRGEFTWGLGLDEPHPRGQYNAFLAAAEAAGPGAWARLSAAPLERGPQVTGVDFPTVAFRRAEWVDGRLHLTVAPLVEDPTATTSFRMSGADGRWRTAGPAASLGPTDDGTGDVIVTVPLSAADLVIEPDRN